MFGFDFSFFWRAANAILHGQSPYSIGGFFSPYPLALLLLPFAFLPFATAYGLWTGLKLLLLAKSGKRWGFIKAILFLPVAFDLLQGQLDLLIFILAIRSNWLGVVMSTVRPQLAIWIVPFSAWNWWKSKKHDQFWKAASGALILYGASTLLEPDWWAKWSNAPKVAWQYNAQSASLFGLAKVLPFSHTAVSIGISILAIFSFVLLRPRTPRAFWQWVSLFNPIANIYSLAILFDQVDWAVILLSWLALPLSQAMHTNAVWALLPLYLILKNRFAPACDKSRQG